MPSSPIYEQALAKLNPEQLSAVTTFDGPVLVVAGPGTGKTQVLALRIAYILLNEEIKPQNILALTFTESGAYAMRERLVQMIGATAYYVHIKTFHSFCNDLILEYPDKFGMRSRDFIPLSELDKLKLIRNLIHTLNLAHLRSFNETYFYVKTILSKIQDLKKEGVDPDDFDELVTKYEQDTENDESLRNKRTGEETDKLRRERKSVKKNQELAKLYRAYQEYLGKEGRYDYEDMIMLVLEKLQTDEEFRLDVQERYLHFLVDEYQDTNGAQNKILMILASYEAFENNPNLFAVGDDDQSIYRFQGASLSNMLTMHKKFPTVKTIVLKTNYRSTQSIIDAATSVIEYNTERITNNVTELDIKKDFVAHKSGGDPVKLYDFSQSVIEQHFLVSKIEELQNNGVSLGEIAVIYRNNGDALEVMNTLNRNKIPYTIEGGLNILIDPFILQCIALLDTVLAPEEAENTERLFTVLHQPWFKFSELDLFRLYRMAKRHRQRTLVDMVQDLKKMNEENMVDGKKIQETVNRMITIKSEISTSTVIDQVETIIRTFGIVDHLLNNNDFRKIHRLNSLYTFIKKQNFEHHHLTLAELMSDLHIMIEEKIAIPEEPLEILEEGVHLMTAHKSKGLEFEHVFIIDCIEKKWGGAKKTDLLKLPPGIIPDYKKIGTEDIEDERRLFYVALTRAKKEVTVSYSRAYPLAEKKNCSASQFINEIKPELIDKESSTPFEQDALKAIQQALQDKNLPPEEDHDLFLRQAVKDYHINAVAFGTYLKCPRLFLYKHLVTVPEKKGKSAVYGTVVHNALEFFFQRFMETKQLPSKSYLMEQFEQQLKSQLTSDEEYSEAFGRGKLVLDKYYDRYESEFTIPMSLEKAYMKNQIVYEGIPLSGRIDKVEQTGATTLRVVDYKTGKARSANDIMGLTESGADKKDYYFQLQFYKLLLSLDRDLRNFQVTEGMLDFVNCDEDGKGFSQVNIAITEEEFTQFTETLKEVYAKIQSLAFPKTDNLKNCEKCPYRSICWKDTLF